MKNVRGMLFAPLHMYVAITEIFCVLFFCRDNFFQYTWMNFDMMATGEADLICYFLPELAADSRRGEKTYGTVNF